jgi:hypothetical protein
MANLRHISDILTVKNMISNAGTNPQSPRSGATQTPPKPQASNDMSRRSRLSPVRLNSPPSAQRWRARPQPRQATDDYDDGAYLEEWMIGYPSVARTTG